MIDSLLLNPGPPGSHAADANPIDESFLPRIRSVFYAVFDIRQGPKIIYQVPEGSIGVPQNIPAPDSAKSPSFTSLRSPSLALTPRTLAAAGDPSDSLIDIEPLILSGPRLRQEGTSPAIRHTDLSSPVDSTSSYADKMHGSPYMGQSHLSQTRPPVLSALSNLAGLSGRGQGSSPLLDFESISEYVIPKTKLCGRLVHCNTPNNRILGFPVILYGDRYRRRDFRFNLCFVFDRMADLSCYEPIVRKCAMVLTNCEEESGFLSRPETSYRMYSILEQLYEDLNSYSETSIRIDSFNSIELKIFPFYPNPPRVDDWQVPIALINLTKRIESNWDLTMAKVIPFVNGINHVRKIADLADTDPKLTRKCMEHLLFYQCVLMVDIFQYSNIYTLKPSMQWLAEDASVQAECGPYVTHSGKPTQPWPRLLKLYAKLKRGKTVHDWIEENDVVGLGIDPRRFLSFGVVKGFVRRVHRYPILLPLGKSPKKKRGGSGYTSRHLDGQDMDSFFGAMRGGSSDLFISPDAAASVGTSSSLATVHGATLGPTSPPLEMPTQLSNVPARRPRHGSIQSTLSAVNLQHSSQPYHASTTSIISSNPTEASELSGSWPDGSGPPTPVLSRANTRLLSGAVGRAAPTTGISTMSTISLASGLAAGANAGALYSSSLADGLGYPDELPELLDGTHHSDELCTKFGLGWKDLEACLSNVGWGIVGQPPQNLRTDDLSWGANTPNLGKVKILYR